MGSNLVICTDGEANRGIGDFNGIDPESVYSKIGRIAAETGIAINLIAIIGQNCNVHALSKMSEISGGQIANIEAPELT